MNAQVQIIKLIEQHKKFADEYLKTHNASESARRAGYSHKSCGQIAAKLLKRTDIQSYLAREVTKIATAENVEPEQTEDLKTRVIRELDTLAFTNIADLIVIDDEGRPSFDLRNATREQLAAITNLKTKSTKRYDNKGQHVATEHELAINLADKYRGLELLGKHAGLFKPDEQRVVLDIADRLVTARRRALLLEAQRGDPE